MFVSQQIESAPPTLAGKEGESYYRAILKQFENQYDQHYNEIKLAFGDGVNVEPMNKRAHQLHTYLFFNPNSNEWLADANVQFNDRISIARNCMTSDINTDHIGRMYMDGHYHGLLILQNIGSQTYEGMINNLTKTSLLNYQITVNLQPLDTYQIMMRENRGPGVGVAGADGNDDFPNPRGHHQAQKARRVPTRRGPHAPVQHAFRGPRLEYRRVQAGGGHERVEAGHHLDQERARLRHAPRGYHARNFLRHSRATVFIPMTPATRACRRACRQSDSLLRELYRRSRQCPGSLAVLRPRALRSALYRQRPVQSTGVAGGSRSGKSVKYNNLLYQTGPYFDYDVMVEEGASHQLHDGPRRKAHRHPEEREYKY
ncbi:hypothetical protein OH491_27995 (plasmid) [Termitidicoccus mucosus]|uniref:hypothetical protein n=1 Tax=Termitidicoccus mucosus TaxID=1184151 RepID=UPI003183731A